MAKFIAKFNYYSWVPPMGDHTPEAWDVETEEIYIHTEKSELTRFKYQRTALGAPFPSKEISVFKIKVWGRAGWNS